MKNALRVLRRDYLRLLKAPAALVVVFVLVVLPSLYTWFNVEGFWNPYDNTGNIRVCVVNEDEGASTDIMGDLDLGSQVVDQLHDNDQLGWTFTDRDTAMEEVKSGKAYAAFIIPSDFSYDVTTFLTGDITQPKLEYYVNEKAGGVSTKVTDTGANTLDETINSTFVSTVSGVVAEEIDEGLKQAEGDIGDARTSIEKQLDKANASLSDARNVVNDLSSASSDLSSKANDAKGKLQGAKGDIANLSQQLSEASDLLSETQQALGPFVVQMTGVLDQSSNLASQAATNANAAVGKVNESISGAEGTVDAAVAQGEATVKMNTAIIASLRSLEETPGLNDETKQAIEESAKTLEAQNNSLQSAVAGVKDTYPALKSASNDITSASEKVNTAFQGTLENTDKYRGTLTSETLPALSDSTTKLSNALSGLSTAVSNQSLLIDQSITALDQLNSALQTTASALGQTDGMLAGFQDDIDTVRTDLVALGTANTLQDLLGEDGLNPEKIAGFMLSPTELQTEELYSVNAYGSAMAPLFMNMTLWIGVFMLLVILRQEVDDEGIPNLSSRERYLGKWLFLAPLVSLQAIVCCAGNLFLGVQVASVPLFFLTAMFASLTYLCIQYALSVLLQHVGKGLCIILIFVQIPGATGLYPIEMTPDFFQAVYPVFPFTYGINALRETIGGFYGLQWLGEVGMLLLYFLAFFVIGFLLRPYLTNVNRMFGKQIAASDILNGEEAKLPARRYRMDQLFRVLADREEYRSQLAESAKRFMGLYPRLRRGGFFFGLAVPAIVTPLLSLLGFEKVIMLTCWLIWLVAIIIFLVVIEFIRDRLAHEVALDDLSDDELRDLFRARDGVSDSPAPQPVDLKGGLK